MNSPHSMVKQVVIGLLLLGQAALLQAQKSPADARVLTDSDRAAIAAAMPAALQTPAVKPRKLLVMSRSMGYYHASTPMGNAFFEQVQQKYGDYAFDFSDNQEDYRAENLQQYDALVFNNCTGFDRNITDPAIRQGILDFVQQGGGLMVIHGGADAGGSWPAYNEMIGFRFMAHPWNWNQEHSCINEDTAHPLTKHLGASFRIQDELYISRDPFFSRDKARVLLSVDLSDQETAARPAEAKKRRHDQDYSLSHVRRFGEGRVFYTTFGHNDSVYKDTRVQTHYLGGLQYVAGDLVVEDLPIAFYDRLRAFNGPLFFEAKLKLIVMARHARTAEDKQKLVDLCSRLIEDEGATDASRQAAIEALSQVATPASIQTVAGLLDDDVLSHAALMFLAQHADVVTFMQVTKTTWSQLDAQGRLNMIQAMAARGPAFADALANLANQGPTEQRIMAIQALGHCATKAQLGDLLGLADAPGVSAARESALIDLAGRLAPADAIPVYQSLLNDRGTVQIRQAALIGCVRLNPAKGQALVLRYLSESDQAMKQAALAASVFVPGEALTAKMGTLAAGESEWNAISLVQTLARRDDAQVLPVLEALLAKPATQIEAINMLGAVGGISQVSVLSTLLYDDDPDVAKAAEGALIRLRAEGVDEAIAQLLLNGAADQQAALLKVADGRRTTVLARAAATLLRSDKSKVAGAALKVVVLNGTLAELKNLCVFALEQPKNSRVRAGIVKLGERLYDDAAVAAMLIESAQRATPGSRLDFIKMLRKFPSAAAESYLLNQLEAGRPDLQLVVVQALADFNSTASVGALLGQCKAGQTAAIKDAAFTGYAHLMAQDRRVAPSMKLAALGGLLDLAETSPRLIAILDTLAGVPDPGVETLASAYLGSADSAVVEAANAAISGSWEMLSKADWTFSSNFNNSPEQHQKMIDLDPATRWTSDVSMSSSEAMWIVVDLGYEQAVNSVILDTTGSAGDFPRTYELYVSNQANDFGAAVASGKGSALTDITCDAVGRYVKIVQTARQGPWWSVHELKINGRPAAK